MKRLMYFMLIVISIQFKLSAQIAEPKDASLIPQIRSGALDLESVKLLGQVAQWSENMKISTDEYLIKDKWGQPLIVRFSQTSERPAPSKWFEIIGTVVVDNARKIRILSENFRKAINDDDSQLKEKLRQNAQMAISDAESAIDKGKGFFSDLKNADRKLEDARSNMSRGEFTLAIADAKAAQQIAENPPFSLAFYIIIAVIVLGIIILVIVIIRGSLGKLENENKKLKEEYEKKLLEVMESLRPKTVPIGDANLSFSEPTVRNETLVVLPFRFDLESNGKNEPVNFYIGRNDADCEFTFGKNTGKELKHVRIDHPTVSHDQAKIIWDKKNQNAKLINHASGNPTRVNGKILELGETCDLNDGDVVMMGIVKLIYRKGVI
jgi:hypothetical protein